MARKAESVGLQPGVVVDDYLIERPTQDHPGVELRYALRDREGRAATLVAARHALFDRHERARFRRLARRRRDLRHRGALRVRAFGEHQGQPYLITERYPERTFADVISEKAPIPPRRLVALLTPVAEALDRAHENGLVHQAFDGDSLLVDRNGDLRLDSFGLLAPTEEAAWSVIQPGDLSYRAPEELRGEPLERSANVYSLTALIVHALTGEPPYAGDRTAVTYAHLADSPPDMRRRVPELGAEIAHVVNWGMSKEPGHRPASPTVLLDAVADALELPGPAPEEEAPARAPAKPGSRVRSRARMPLRWRGVALAVVAAALAAASGALAAVAVDPFGDDATSAPPSRVDTSIWERVSDRRVELRRALAGAETPQDQAAAATQLGGVYDRVADAAPPGRLAGAARGASGAYFELAAAAEAADATAFDDAAAAVTAAERRVVAVARR